MYFIIFNAHVVLNILLHIYIVRAEFVIQFNNAQYIML